MKSRKKDTRKRPDKAREKGSGPKPPPPQKVPPVRPTKMAPAKREADGALAGPDVWKSLRDEFKALGREEEALQAEVYDTARSIKPDSMVEFCPCGTGYSFFTMPYMNMAVASDPESSWQIRLKGKTLKALMGGSIAYFGDHVDMSDGGDDFASTVGIGGVVGTNFT